MSKKIFLLFLSFAFAVTAHANNDALLSARGKELISSKKFSGFQENKGQLKDSDGKPVPFVLFKTEAPGIHLYLTKTGLTYVFLHSEEKKEKKRDELETKKDEDIKIRWERIDLLLKNASIKNENIIVEGKSADFSQYFYAHCPEGVTDVRRYEKITVQNIYPGIDWVLYNSSEKGFKYDFVVHPGADPTLIQLSYSSKEKLKISENGSLQIRTKYGHLSENAPESFLDGKSVGSKFKSIGSCKNNLGGIDVVVGFEFETLDFKPGTLVIDPQLTWATFFGGSVHEGAQSITCDPAGDITIVGYLASADFPVFDPGIGNYYQGTFAGGNGNDAFIIKFSNSGTQLWSTYYGGTDGEEGNYVTNDQNGNIFVTGYTSSTNFPTLNPGGGTYFQPANGGSNDAYILKFSNAGVRLWATYYGGNDADMGRGLNIDAVGNLCMTGPTSSTNFPTLNPGGGAFFQPAFGAPFGSSNAYLLKFTNAGVPLWATYLGGNVGDGGMSISTDQNNNIFAVGYTRSPNFPILNPGGGALFQPAPTGNRNGYITKFSSTGVLIWGTFYGGSSSDVTAAVVNDAAGNVFISGSGYSANLTMLNPGGGAYFQSAPGGGNEVFILKFNNSGVLLWGTYYGGTGDEGYYCGDHLLVDNCDNVYLSFYTNSTNVPVKTFCTLGFNDASLNGASDQFIAKFSNTGVHIWGTYIGGDGGDFSEATAMDNSGNLFVSGEWSTVTNAATYPLTNPGGGAYFDNVWGGGADDSFVLKMEPVASTPTATSSNAGCSCAGSATATISNTGCSGPTYTYAWSNGTTVGPTTGLTSTIANLCAGTYSVIISYGACSMPDTLTYTITGTAGGFTVNVVPTNAVCSSPNGSATSSVNGGTSPFTYSWSNGQSTSAASGLAAGNYTCTITDGSGCTNTQTFSITSSGGYSVAISPTNAVCSAANGNATANITGGTAPYTYSWSNGQTSSVATGLAAGNYTCNITDATGCSNTQTFTISSSSGTLNAAIASASVTCNGGNSGTASVTPAGGTAPYTYSWSNGQNISAVTNLSAGNFSVVVTDASGCSSTQTVSITQPSPITSSITNTPSTCNSSDGTATSSAAGGTGGFTYVWSNGQTAQIATGLTAGNYSVTVTDANGCTHVNSTTILNSNGPTANAGSNVSINQGNNTTLTASGGGSYAWNNGLSTAIIAVAPTVTTTYCVIVTDANGCTDSSCVTVFVVPEPVPCGEFYLPNAFSPNEDAENDVFQAYISASCVTEFKLIIYNRWGEKVFETTDVTQGWNGEFRGAMSNPAVYAYYCKATLTNGKEILKEGNVSLVR